MKRNNDSASSLRWRNRRRMAWIAFLAGIFYPLLYLKTDSQALVDLAVHFYAFCTIVVGMYIGSATFEDVKLLKPKYQIDDPDRFNTEEECNDSRNPKC